MEEGSAALRVELGGCGVSIGGVSWETMQLDLLGASGCWPEVERPARPDVQSGRGAVTTPATNTTQLTIAQTKIKNRKQKRPITHPGLADRDAIAVCDWRASVRATPSCRSDDARDGR